MSVKTILLAHGSSDLNWSRTFEELAAPALARHNSSELAFMELSKPSLEDKVKEAKDQGAEKVLVLPLFLAEGRHLRKDVPAMLAEYEERYGIKTSLLPPIGKHPKLSEALADIVSDMIP